MNGRTITRMAMVLALIGLTDAAYLTVTHYTNTQVACPDSGLINCENVLNSPYSTIFGVPFAVLGLAFFIVEIVVIMLKQRDLFIVYNGIGIAVVVQLLYIEYLVGSICIYCTLVHILVVLIFVLAVLNYNATGSVGSRATPAGQNKQAHQPLSRKTY